MPAVDAAFQLSFCSAAGSVALLCLSVLSTSRVCKSKETAEEDKIV